MVKKLPHFASLKSVFENLSPRPNVPYYTLISEVLQRHISGVLSGKSDTAHALQEAEKETKKIIEKYEQK